MVGGYAMNWRDLALKAGIVALIVLLQLGPWMFYICPNNPGACSL
jgi:hypothetical protein